MITNSDFSPANKYLVIDSRDDEVATMRAKINSHMIVLDSSDDITVGNQFANEIQEAVDKEQNITLIWTQHIPSAVKSFQQGIIQSVQIANGADFPINIAVYEIGDETNQIFTSGNSKSKVLSDIDELILESRDRETASMLEEVDVDSESKGLIENLSRDNREKTEELKKANQVRDEALNSQNDLKAQILLKDDLIKKLQKQVDESQRLQKEAETKFDNQVDNVEALQRNVDELNKKYSDLKINSDQKDLHIQKLEEENQGYVSTLNAKDTQILDLQSAYDEEKTKNLTMENDANDMSDEISKARSDSKRLASLQDENAELRGEKTRLEIQVKANTELIKNLRSNSSATNDQVLPVIHFNNIQIMYFRVLNDLPYFHWYMQQMRELLSLLSQGKTVKIINIRRDHELDVQFIGIDKIANIGSATSEESYLIPNSAMDDGQATFENTCDILIVLDYTGKQDSIIKTSNLFDEYVVLPDSKDAKKINAPGGVISNSDDSILDLRFNEDFIRYPESVQKLAEQVIVNFLATSKVAQSYSS